MQNLIHSNYILFLSKLLHSENLLIFFSLPLIVVVFVSFVDINHRAAGYRHILAILDI